MASIEPLRKILHVWGSVALLIASLTPGGATQSVRTAAEG